MAKGTLLNRRQQDSHRGLAICALALGVVLACAPEVASAAGVVTPSVVGGQDAPRGRFKHQIGLIINGGFCGGSLIRTDVVLTAAHCFDNLQPPADNIQAYAGSYNYYGDSNADGTAYSASQVIVNQAYNGQTSQNDMAVIFLNQCVELNSNTQTIKLATQEDMDASLSSVWAITGWGTTSSGAASNGQNGDTPAVMQMGHVKYVDAQTCQSQVSDYDASVMICAGGVTAVDGGSVPFQDTCQGDSGGPLTINLADGIAPENGDWTQDRLLGVVSFGTGCGQQDSPGVYTRVPALTSWINEQLAQVASPCGSGTPSPPPPAAEAPSPPPPVDDFPSPPPPVDDFPSPPPPVDDFPSPPPPVDDFPSPPPPVDDFPSPPPPVDDFPSPPPPDFFDSPPPPPDFFGSPPPPPDFSPSPPPPPDSGGGGGGGGSPAGISQVSSGFSWFGTPDTFVKGGATEFRAEAKCRKTCMKRAYSDSCAAFSLTYVAVGFRGKRRYFCEIYWSAPARLCTASDTTEECTSLTAGAYAVTYI